jgi:hypothetical protein
VTPRRAVALTLGLALAAGLTVAVVQRQGSDESRDVLLPASTGMLQPTPTVPTSAAPVVPVRATLSPAARRPRLPAWVHVDVPRVRVEPSCPDTQDAPEPSTRAVVPEQGDDENQDLLAEGGHAWLTFGDVDGRTRLVTLDLASGRSRSLDLAGATPEALGDAELWASGWGGHGPALTRVPQGGHRVERTWDEGDLAGGRADHVAYSDGVVFLLRFDDD